MNVIFFMTDQQHADCLGFLGHPILKTPNLDALASRGAHFTNMYTCSTICGPSRTSFFTGAYVRTHEQFANNADPRREFPSILTELKRAGYTTFQCGKSHLTETIAKDFDEMWDMKKYQEHLRAEGLTRQTMTEELHKNFMSYVSPLPENEQNEVWTADRAIDFLKSPKAEEAPFFIWCSFQRPHAPHCPPASFDDLYDPDDIPIDWEEYHRFEASRMQKRPMIEDFWKIGSVRHDLSIFKKAVCRYLAMITLVDRAVGRVLDTLAERGLEEETIVVFTADHGDWAGHYGQLGKNLPGYDDIMHIPFIYYDPKRGDAGRALVGMHESVDLFPSLMDRLGLPTPPTVQGTSFLRALDGRPGSSRDAVFAEWPMEKTIRTKDWKLTFFVRHPHKGQLFRMGPHPDETDNLWDDPAHSHVKTELLQELMAWMVKCEQPTALTAQAEEHVATRWNDWLLSGGE